MKTLAKLVVILCAVYACLGATPIYRLLDVMDVPQVIISGGSTVITGERPVLSDLSATIVPTRNGDTLYVDVSASSDSAIVWTVTASYVTTFPQFEWPATDYYEYKTAAVGLHYATEPSRSTSIEDLRIIIGPRAYHADSVIVYAQGKPQFGPSSLPTIVGRYAIDMPFGDPLSVDADNYRIGAIHLSGYDPGMQGYTLAEWSRAQTLICVTGFLFQSTWTTTGWDHWVERMRDEETSNNVAVVGFTGLTVKDYPTFPFKQRQYRMFERMSNAGAAYSDSVYCRRTDGSVITNGDNAGTKIINVYCKAARDSLAWFWANEWNHCENREPGVGILFDLYEYWNEYSDGTSYSGDIIDRNLNGVAMLYDDAELLETRLCRIYLLRAIRAAIAATDTETDVGDCFLLGANTVGGKIDATLLAELDVIFDEGIQCPAPLGTAYTEFTVGGDEVASPYVRPLLETYTRDLTNSDGIYDNALVNDSVLPNPSDLNHTWMGLASAMRTEGGGPFIVLESHAHAGQHPERIEVLSLLVDYTYALYGRHAYVVNQRQLWSPSNEGKTSLSGLGAPIDAVMQRDEQDGLALWTRQFTNGDVSVLIDTTATFDCAAGDSFEYQVNVGGTPVRESLGWSSDLTAPVLSDFRYAWHDTTSTILFGASYDTDEIGGTLTKEFYWVSEGASYQSGGTAAVSQYDDAIFYVDTNDTTSVLPDTLHVRGTATDATDNVSNVIHLAVYIERKPADDETAPVLTIEDFLVDALDPDGEIRCLATVTTDETATLGVTWKRFVGGTYADTLWSDGEVDTLVATIETDITPVDNDTFYLRAVGYDAAENYATAKWMTDVADFPDQPTSLVATGGDGEIALDWDDNAEGNITGYDVYRRNATGSLALFDEDIAVSNYTDSTVPNDSTYYYTVTAKDDLGFVSAQSAEDSDAAAAGGGDPYTWIFDQGSMMPYFATWGYSTSDTTGNTDHTTTIERAAVTWNNMATVTSDQGLLWVFPSASDATYSDSSNRLMLMLHFPDISAALSGATIDSARIFFRTSTAIDFSDASDYIDFIIPNNNVYDEWTDGTTAGDYDCSGNYADASTTTAWSETFSWSAASGLGWVTVFGGDGDTYDTTADDGDDTCRLSTTGVQAWADGTHEPQIWISPTLTMGLRGLSVSNLTARPSIVIWGTK